MGGAQEAKTAEGSEAAESGGADRRASEMGSQGTGDGFISVFFFFQGRGPTKILVFFPLVSIFLHQKGGWDQASHPCAFFCVRPWTTRNGFLASNPSKLNTISVLFRLV